MSDQHPHLSSEAMHAFLEGALPPAERADAEGHLAHCARCSSQLEGWSLLFAELGELPELAPSPGFAERVMAELPPPRPFWSRAGAWLMARGSDAHLSPARAQDYLEGLLVGNGRREIETHLAACGSCQDEIASWAPVFARLSDLPHFAPPVGFAARVMAAWEALPAPTPVVRTSLAAQLANWGRAAVRRLTPTTRRGWALAGTVVTAPAVALVVMVGGVLLHPLLTFRDLGVYLTWKGLEGFQAVTGAVAAYALESPALFWMYSLVEAVLASPGIALGGIAALWGITLASAWVLYRQVIAPMRMARQHAQAS